MVLDALVDGEGQQVPALRQLVALFIPELNLVDRQAHEVEPQRIQACEIILLDVLLAGFTTLLTLRQPVAEVSAALNTEVIHSSVFLTLGGTSRKGQHGDGDNSHR